MLIKSVTCFALVFMPFMVFSEGSEQNPIVKPEIIDDLSLGGRLQPRYELTQSANEEDRSSFYIRRARLDARGTLFNGNLRFRIMPELARNASMRDAWINYEFSKAVQLRGGQMPVPFHWHRFVSSTRQHFAERGEPSQIMGYPTGYDIGLMLHGRNQANTVSYAAGLYDGAGRNNKFSNSNGHMVSGRISIAALGELPEEETDLYRSVSPKLAFGGGLQAANKNEVRAWDLNQSTNDNGRGDFLSATADMRFAFQGFSLAGEFYRRYVRPDDRDVNEYDGYGYLVTAGATIIAGRLDIVGRYSELELNTASPETRRQQWGSGFNIYYDNHRAKTRIQYLRNNGNNTGGALIIEQHIQF